MDLKVKYEDLKKSSQIKFKIDIPYAEIEKEQLAAEKDLSHKVQLDGFRAGKVPRAIIQKRFGDLIKKETTEKIIQKALSEVLKKENLQTFGAPTVQNITGGDNNKPLVVEIIADKPPVCQIGTINQLPITENTCQVMPEDIEKEIANLLKNSTKIEDANTFDNNNGALMLNVQVLTPAFAHHSRENMLLTANADLSPDVFELRGELPHLKIDEEKVIEKKYHKNHPDKEIASKTLSLKVKASAFKKLIVPTIDDEMLKQFDCQDEKELREKIKNAMEGEVEKKLTTQKNDALLEAAKQKATFSIAPSVVEHATEHYLNSALKQQGANNNVDEKTLSSLKENYSKMTLEKIQSELLLEKIVENEKLQISEAIISEEIETFAKNQGKDYQEVRREMIKNGDYTQLKNQLLLKEVFSYLNKKASIKKTKKISFADLVYAQPH